MKGQAFNDETEVGAMIEIPSAAISADRLAREVDFFSIGTNDLIQYAIAVDRVNERIAHLYEPTHPAVLRLLKMVADAAHAHGIWVGVCGEMAGDLALVPLLLGLGMDELSVGASLVPRVKRAVQSLSHTECQQLVGRTIGTRYLGGNSGALHGDGAKTLRRSARVMEGSDSSISDSLITDHIYSRTAVASLPLRSRRKFSLARRARPSFSTSTFAMRGEWSGNTRSTPSP